MSLIKGRKVVPEDYRLLTDDEEVPAEGDVFVSLERLSSLIGLGGAAFEGRQGRTGVWVSGDTEPEALLPHLDFLDAIALKLPRYTDGRAYSTARLLRLRHGFKGELRAVGHVLRDQLAYLARCGFDAFELAEGHDAESALAAFDEFSVHYQPDAADFVPAKNAGSHGDAP